jgi:hypothetical protein
MAELTPKQKIAQAKYASKVCGYLNIDKKHCEKLFAKLLENMKSAIAGIPTE